MSNPEIVQKANISMTNSNMINFNNGINQGSIVITKNINKTPDRVRIQNGRQRNLSQASQELNKKNSNEVDLVADYSG